MALTDLLFADAKAKKLHDCSICPKSQQAQRKCMSPGFENVKTPRFRVDDHGQKFTFCPGKATWYAQTVLVFEQCLFAIETGIMPEDGHFHDQSELFVNVYPTFVKQYKLRKYQRIWGDISIFTSEVFKAVGKMLGGKKKG